MRKLILLIVLFCALIAFALVALLLRPVTAPPENPPPGPVATTTASTTEPILIDRGYGPRYQEFISGTQETSPWVTLEDAGPVVTLDPWVSAIGITIEPRIYELLEQGEWKLYRCADRSDYPAPSLVLSITFQLLPNYPGNLYRNQLAFLDAWEKTLVNDMRPLLFPNEPVEATLEQSGDFKNTKWHEYAGMREVPVRASSGTERTIGYAFVDDELMVGNDMTCLIQVQEYLFDPGESDGIPRQQIPE